MNLLKLSWKYLAAKPLASLLSIILVALGVSLTSILLLLNQQFKDRLYNNIDGIDLVVSAKGSPLQMILSSVYQIQPATGNIPLKESFVVTKNPYIEKAIPLTMGDTYKGYRIIGTDSQYIAHYKGKIAKGREFEQDLEVTVGSRCAQKLNLKIGDTFYGSHGLVADGGDVHKTYAYEVVGILKETNKVIDQLILTNVASTWRMHEDHDHGEEAEHAHAQESEEQHDHAAHDHAHENEEVHVHESEEQHDHAAHDHDHKKTVLEPISAKGKSITSYLVTYKKDRNGNSSARAFVECTNIIEENSESLACAKPSIELQKLLELTGMGMDSLKFLALIIIFISAFSMFISLYASLQERRYEIALMRVGGAARSKIFLMIIIEGLLIAVGGLAIGMLISHLGMQMMASSLEESYKYTFTGWLFLIEELWLALGTLVIGFFAAIIPAIQAYKTDISTTLSNN